MQVIPNKTELREHPSPAAGGTIERVETPSIKANNPSPYKKQPDPRIPPPKKMNPAPIGAAKPLIA